MKPAIVVVMGVSGSGKSYLGNLLAETTGWPFAEGDDYHSDANKAQMHAGIALTDAEREPWLEALHALLQSWHNSNQSGILSCSSLRAPYRATLRAGLKEVCFVWLDVSRKILEDRLTHRAGHFMPAALLDSQLATLEPPLGETNTLRLDGTGPAEESVATILAWLEDQQ